jgi:copper(I)-binding protein
MSRLSRRGVLAAALSAFVALPAAAHDYALGDLAIHHPWSRATPPSAKVGAGYLAVVNRGASPDRLVGARSPAAGRVEIHEMRMDGGIMRMRALDGGLELPPGGRVELKPGGFHLMLLDLKAPLREGAAVPLTLVFQRAGQVDVELKIEPAAARQSGHGAHGHGPAPAHRH